MKKTPFDFFIGATRPITNFNRIASGADNLEKKELAPAFSLYTLFSLYVIVGTLFVEE